MVSLASLWLPILLSAVAIFVASSIAWMALPHHKNDWQKLKSDDAIQDAVRSQALAPGQYMYPACMPQDVKTPEGKARFERGPWGTLIVLGGRPNMGRALPIWILHLAIVATIVAYVVGHALGPGEPFRHVLRLASAIAWLGYSAGAVPNAIWEGKPWHVAWKVIADGLVYAFITGAIFGWLWPSAPSA